MLNELVAGLKFCYSLRLYRKDPLRSINSSTGLTALSEQDSLGGMVCLRHSTPTSVIWIMMLDA